MTIEPWIWSDDVVRQTRAGQVGQKLTLVKSSTGMVKQDGSSKLEKIHRYTSDMNN